MVRGVGAFQTGTNGRSSRGGGPLAGLSRAAFHETFGTYGYLMKCGRNAARSRAAMSPFNAFCFCRAWRRWSLRMSRHVETPGQSPPNLDGHASPSNVTYRACPPARYRPLVQKYLPDGAGSVFSFDAREAAPPDRTSSASPLLVAPGQRGRRQA